MIPLQIFEKHPEADAYRVGGFYSPYALVATEKRFTDAELAAEYHKQGHVFMLNGGARARDSIYQSQIWDTLYRFASLPHAHETDYQ